MTDSRWYEDGLQFKCTQCGNCCTGSPGYVWVNDEDLQNIAEYLDKPIGEVRLLQTRPVRGKISLKEFPNGDCIYFHPKKRSCKIYPVRPIQCRTWPFWKSNLETPERWQETGRGCPGIGQGSFVELEVIERQLSQTDL